MCHTNVMPAGLVGTINNGDLSFLVTKSSLSVATILTNTYALDTECFHGNRLSFKSKLDGLEIEMCHWLVNPCNVEKTALKHCRHTV